MTIVAGMLALACAALFASMAVGTVSLTQLTERDQQEMGLLLPEEMQ